MSYFDIDQLIIKKPDKNQAKKSAGETKKLDFEQLEDWSEIMRSEIEIKDYPNGWFGMHLRCA